MARETKAQRLEREEREAAEREANARAQYFPNLMATLERASKNLFELTVVDGKFVVRDVNDSRNTWTFDTEYNSVSENLMWGLNYELDLLEEAERLAQRNAMVRNQALSKLSAEEREVLGL